MGMAGNLTVLMEARQQDPAFHLLQAPAEADATTRFLSTHPTVDVLPKHDPSLGKSPATSVGFRAVILTDSLTVLTMTKHGRSVP